VDARVAMGGGGVERNEVLNPGKGFGKGRDRLVWMQEKLYN